MFKYRVVISNVFLLNFMWLWKLFIPVTVFRRDNVMGRAFEEIICSLHRVFILKYFVFGHFWGSAVLRFSWLTLLGKSIQESPCLQFDNFGRGSIDKPHHSVSLRLKFNQDMFQEAFKRRTSTFTLLKKNMLWIFIVFWKTSEEPSYKQSSFITLNL